MVIAYLFYVTINNVYKMLPIEYNKSYKIKKNSDIRYFRFILCYTGYWPQCQNIFIYLTQIKCWKWVLRIHFSMNYLFLCICAPGFIRLLLSSYKQHICFRRYFVILKNIHLIPFYLHNSSYLVYPWIITYFAISVFIFLFADKGRNLTGFG